MKKLEQAIAADLDGKDAYLVYADWLQTQSDPRGELITLQAAKPNARIRKAEAALLAKHEAHFFGALRKLLTVEWHFGYFKSMHLGWREGAPVVEILSDVFRLASAKYVRDLSFGITADGRADYDQIVKRLAKVKMPFLRSLYLGDVFTTWDGDWDRSWTNIGLIAPLYRAFPKLERLCIHGNNIALGTLEHANLRELEVCDESSTESIVNALCKAKLPKLERLSVDLGGSSNRIPSLRPILEGRFPALRHLSLEWTSPSRDDLEALGKGKTLAKLQTLSLASCALTDTKAEMLLAHAPRYKHLTAFDLDNNHLSAKTQKLVKKLC